MSFVEYLPFKGSSQFYEVFQMRNCQEILLRKDITEEEKILSVIAPNHLLQNKVRLMREMVTNKIMM